MRLGDAFISNSEKLFWTWNLILYDSRLKSPSVLAYWLMHTRLFLQYHDNLNLTFSNEYLQVTPHWLNITVAIQWNEHLTY